ncbi:hypothetical protein QUF61_02170 [Candidatus Venteria ishoeyi]|uniref:hypothetical protein n=1 Tax=Candidatus Venteria ishoeyi TaxID=1899563 RepID=UPI0025A5CB7B|nr:hypothetical protein [Candidatus Venteria ishoeyi]MDM8545277.1 hypothetical protein [Candidatus Venteria ishoeyi]
MAIIDTDNNRVVIRIIYEGASKAGKTRSLYALQKKLKTPGGVFDPQQRKDDGEDYIATQSFEWLSYIGGLFENSKIEAQIISLPGELCCRAQREALLKTADAIIFVLDSRLENLPLNLEHLRRLQSWRDSRDIAPGLIIQNNFEDSAECLSNQQLQQLLNISDRLEKVMSSAASTGQGIREIFVATVRLALNHLTTCREQGQNLFAKVPINNGEKLQHWWQNADLAEATQDGFTALLSAQVDNNDSSLPTIADTASPTLYPLRLERHLPTTPTPDVPVTWRNPPLATRQALQQLNACNLTLVEYAENLWRATDSAQQWYCWSHNEWLHDTLDNALLNLQNHTRLRLLHQDYLPTAHYYTISHQASYRWRLWQIVKTCKTLGQEQKKMHQGLSAEAFIEKLLQQANTLYATFQNLSSVMHLSDLHWDNFQKNPQGHYEYLGPIHEQSETEIMDKTIILDHIQHICGQAVIAAMDDNLDLCAALEHLEKWEIECDAQQCTEMAVRLADLLR